MLTLFILAIALATDAFAVSIARGANFGHSWIRALMVGLVFGMMQGLAVILGWWAGLTLSEAFQTLQGWIASSALILLGGLMIKAALNDHQDAEIAYDPVSPVVALIGLISAALVVSLDCLAAGVALPALGYSITLDAFVVFGVSFLMSTLGYCLGGHASNKLGKYAEIAGGLVLIGLGLKIILYP